MTSRSSNKLWFRGRHVEYLFGLTFVRLLEKNSELSNGRIPVPGPRPDLDLENRVVDGVLIASE